MGPFKLNTTDLLKLCIPLLVVFIYVKMFIPQRWGYFTGDPMVPLVNIYAVKNGKVQDQSLIQNNLSYGMGISRKGRVLYNTSKRMMTSAKKLEWKAAAGEKMIPPSEQYTPISFKNNNNIFSGPLLLTRLKRSRVSFGRQQVDTTEYVFVNALP